ncbi:MULTISPECIES: DUF6945 domain-containing protein [Enterobacter]|uniref:DUF6945 domain-containing protein n=1 Tax=Enterobacter TaxID=547 RepID=UPI0010A6313A|nr:hypothetical protein [Enterobacter roggenkampii]ELJ5793351.1 hypothetical protein [Enterobacter roggenkampii]MCE1352100.1 hypothetical protein [Enterobacter roggenkampii]MCK7303176.1 hypothetical protein [Enterobacter roggenkampii]MCL5492900.1 hypothetical protein [Enterobacter roggenkampii]MDV0393745.1 hypothetical protein [Enterobacter roggenkampii]
MSQNGNTNERFYKSENRLFHADTVTNKSTGEVVEISNSLEKLYAYMLSQYRFWSGLNQQFAESQERLGTVARIGDAKKKTKPQIDKLIALGLVEITGKVGRCNIYKVIDVDKVAGNLEFSYPEWAGEPMYDHEKRLGKSSQQPKNEEKKGNGEQAQQQEHEQQSPGVASESAKDDPQQRSGVSQSAGDSGDDVSGSDEVKKRFYADLNTLNNWVEGYDDEGFMAYGATWGIEKPGAITDLIKSHIRIIQSDGYKGSRSAANDTSSGPDAYYKQQQARKAAEAKQATNTPQQQEDEQLEFDDEKPF